MRYIDIEMYKWKWHHDVYLINKQKFPYFSWNGYWLEGAAFVSIMPRRTGKTQMIIMLTQHMEKKLENYRVVCQNIMTKEGLARRGVDIHRIEICSRFGTNDNPFRGINHKDTNLLIDEFTHISKKNHLLHILDFPWKTVTMVGSL
jgi:hypothetical protein